jgi:hypothetical protein
MITKGIHNPDITHFPGTTIHGYRGYNNDKCFSLIEDSNMDLLNTTKLGPLACKFGTAHHNTLCEQRKMPENGLTLSLGATCSIGDTTSHFIAYHIGTGQVRFFQRSIPLLMYSSFDITTVHIDKHYAKTFSSMLKKLKEADE